MERIYLTRRNLLTLLSKLDRAKAGEQTYCTLVKCDKLHPQYPQTMDRCEVIAIEDDTYYTDRPAGPVLPADDPNKHRRHSD